MSEAATKRAFGALVQASTLDAFLAPAATLVDECRLNIDEQGLRICVVDPAGVGMCETTLDADAFDTYDSGDGGTIGINLSRLRKVSNLADADDVIRLTLDFEQSTPAIDIGGIDYSLGLIDPDSIRQEPEIPDLDLPANVVCEGNQLKQAIKAADMVHDHIRVGADPDDEIATFHSQGDRDDVTLTLGYDELLDASIDAPVESIFSLNYLEDMAKAIDKDAELTIEIGNEMPMSIGFDMVEGFGSARFMLAPRIARSD